MLGESRVHQEMHLHSVRSYSQVFFMPGGLYHSYQTLSNEWKVFCLMMEQAQVDARMIHRVSSMEMLRIE